MIFVNYANYYYKNKAAQKNDKKVIIKTLTIYIKMKLEILL